MEGGARNQETGKRIPLYYIFWNGEEIIVHPRVLGVHILYNCFQFSLSAMTRR